ncbi:ATP-binding cassette domain-containing protein [Paludifilum halophilum]|uniref:Bacitracin ABC transporter ATP-binding protein n=1 Tax=Paludifilum halophilum TaxID=1642702 RepID=A0A235B5Q4_9BACL|nr:ATP-binding cassette domain-containing protein [Paludifilum halophilum]OYD06925.1 bacitracin ABC transporter ATP-binding protein [Paludifilum halophilum]
MEETMVQTTDLTRRYGTAAVVDRINITVRRGEVYGFLGPNGAGKTTTIRMLLGLIRSTSGEVEIFGQPLKRKRTDILKKVGSLVESPSYYGHLSGRENMEVARRLLDVPKSRIDRVLEMVRLIPAADKKVKQYSLGMKQRLGIAMALLGNPELLILDEPTNGLDPAGIQEIRELIVDMPKQHGITILVSSHLLNEIDQMATQVGIIHQGKMIFQDDIRVLRRQSNPRIRIGAGDAREACQALRDRGWDVTLDRDGLWMQGLNRRETAQVVETLVMDRFSVYRVEEVKPSLEEIFLELTGKENSL